MLYIFDLDGTLYRGEEPCPHAPETVAELRRRGHTIRYLTNNSSKTQADQATKLTRLGFACEPNEVTTSAVGMAKHLVRAGYRSAHVVGEQGLKDTLRDGGVEVSDSGEVVVAGVCRTLTYDMIDKALQLLLKGVPFFATNADATYPLEQGRLQPGAGATVGALKGCSGVEPTVIGKPSGYLVNLILEETGAVPEDTILVGDRFETDIMAGLNAGCRVHLVFTGVTEAPVNDIPYSDDLRGLLL